MDLICPRCSEPWDALEVQQDFTPDQRRDFTAGLGCTPACAREPHVANVATACAAAMYDLLGDDLDGAASMLEDARAMGML